MVLISAQFRTFSGMPLAHLLVDNLQRGALS
jgi:hypothetical protein